MKWVCQECGQRFETGDEEPKVVCPNCLSVEVVAVTEIEWCKQLLMEGHCRQGEDDPRMCENYSCTFVLEWYDRRRNVYG